MNIKQLKEYLQQFDESLQVGGLDEGGCLAPTTVEDIVIINMCGKEILLITGDYKENFK